MQCPASFRPTPIPPKPGHTFWTACHRCKMHYMYLRTYENYQLQCPKCKVVFMAREIHRTGWVTEMARDASKAEVDGIAGRNIKRKKQNSEQEGDEDLADNDKKCHGQTMQDDQFSSELPGRKPSRSKKKAVTHKADIMSDDSDLDDFPSAKRSKIQGGAEDGVKSEDEEAGLQQSERVLKDMSVGKDCNHSGRRGVGVNSSKELDGRKHVNEQNGADQGEPAKKNHPKYSSETLWTSCSNCKMQKQYLRQYQYYQLQCPKCKEYFLALDIKRTAPSNAADGFGLDFGSNNQRASAACNQSNHRPKNGGEGAFNPFPDNTSSASFFSSAAAAAAQLRARVEAAAAGAHAAFSAVPSKDLAADVAQKAFVELKRENVEAEEEVNRKEEEAKRKEEELKRKEEELERKEEELKRKEKELKSNEEKLQKEKERLREEKEVQGKSLEAARSWEAVERLVAKHKQQEMVARDARKRKVDA